MNLSYEMQDCLTDMAGWIWFAMVAIVMTIGPVCFRRQFTKYTHAQCGVIKSLLVSFLAGLISIILFYLIFFVFVVNGSDNFLPLILLLIYFPVLHIFIIGITKIKAPQTIPVRTGWHLTVMTGCFTVLFSFIVSHSISLIIVRVESDYYMQRLSYYIDEYRQKNGSYPKEMADIPATEFLSVSFMQNNSFLWHNEPTKSAISSARDYYQFLPLPDNAPKDLLWIWVAPQIVPSSKTPVMLFDQTTKMIPKKDFSFLLERSQKWLADHPPATHGK